MGVEPGRGRGGGGGCQAARVDVNDDGLDCPPTDFPPAEVTSSDDEVPQAVCGGECGRPYPKAAFKKVS